MSPEPGTPTSPHRVGYVLHRFPYRTETFIFREMHRLLGRGFDLTIFPLLDSDQRPSSPELDALMPRARYGSGASWNALRAQLSFLKRKPARYFRSFARLIQMTWREPRVMIRALALYPRSVQIAGEVERLGIHHLHAHFVWLEALTAMVVRELTGATYSVQPHAFGMFSRNQINVRRQLEDADHIITISEYNAKVIAGLTPRRAPSDISVVHCGVDPSVFSPGDSGPHDRARILSVGRAVEKKGHEYLIEACRVLRDSGRSFECRIVTGATDERPGLQALIDRLGLSDLVVLLGAVDQDELIERYRSSDVFVLASVIAASGDRDGVPVSLMEAMACGVAVVTTDVSGIPELVEHGVSGLVCPPRDAEAIAHAIESLIDDDDLRRRLAAGGWAKVEADYDLAKTADETASVFARLMSASG